MKRISKPHWVFGAVLLVALLTGVVSFRTEHMTDSEIELARAQKDWDSYVSKGFTEVNADSNPVVQASLDRLNKAKGVSSKQSRSDTIDTTTIVLIVVASLTVVGLGVWAYRRWSTPAYPVYGARRR